MNEKVYTWVFAAGGSEVDCVNMDYIKGTTELALLYLLAQVQGDRANDPDNWEMGTESVGEIRGDEEGNYYAYANYSDYHIDYALKRLDQEPEDLSELEESLREVPNHTFDDYDEDEDEYDDGDKDPEDFEEEE